MGGVTLFNVLVVLAAVTGANASTLRITGGSVTTINSYPSMAAILTSDDLVNFRQDCGGTIINNRAILTAAHCFHRGNILQRSRVRLGSTWANSGGVVHTLSRAIIHPQYFLVQNDVAILHTSSFISFNNAVQAGSLAGANYNVPDSTAVWATGWGRTGPDQPLSEQLRHVQLWTLSQAQCAERYGTAVNDNTICAAPRSDGAGQCSGDSGGPLYHNNVIISVLSFGGTCGAAADPSVSMRVSRYIDWIISNA
ncbi:trypsin, alkaline B-like [Anticarsia gemmatalis]|uniref:trypsin, alkaline B-like n=1 Tax=Anticarsia gemmatalis TaxID=129554 RepID=UPI003F775AEB